MGGPAQAPAPKAAPAAAVEHETRNPLADVSTGAGRAGFFAESSPSSASKLSLYTQSILGLVNQLQDPKTESSALREIQKTLGSTRLRELTLRSLSEIASSPEANHQAHKDALTYLAFTDQKRGVIAAIKAAERDPETRPVALKILENALHNHDEGTRGMAQVGLERLGARTAQSTASTFGREFLHEVGATAGEVKASAKSGMAAAGAAYKEHVAPGVDKALALPGVKSVVGAVKTVAEFKIEPNKGLNAVDTSQLIRSGVNPETFALEPAVQKAKPE